MRIVRNNQTCGCRCFGVNLTVTKKHKIYCCKGWLRDKNLMGVLVLLVINVLSLCFRSAHIQQVGLCHFHDVGLLTNGSSAFKKKETKKESSAAIGLKACFNITSLSSQPIPSAQDTKSWMSLKNTIVWLLPHFPGGNELQKWILRVPYNL